MSDKYFEFYNGVKILNGEYAIENIAYELSYHNVTKPLLLSGKKLEDIGLVSSLRQMIAGVNIEAIFTNIPNDSSTETIDFIIDYYEDNGCDCIIALGGGSVIDTAKCVKMAISQNAHSILELMGNENLVAGKHIPLFIVPTTLGTGAECTTVAVIKNAKTNTKMEFISAELLPDAIFLDARMTATLPPSMIGATAMDALCHAIEAYSCIQKNPISDIYATASIKIISENIIKAVKTQSAECRQQLALGASLAGVAFSNSMVGVVHAIVHAIGGVCGVPHANAIAILLPACMEYYSAVYAKEYSNLLLYLTDEETYATTPAELRSRMSAEIVKKIKKTLGYVAKMPTDFSAYGVTERDFAEIITKAKSDGAILMSPRLVTKSDIYNILQMCM